MVHPVGILLWSKTLRPFYFAIMTNFYNILHRVYRVNLQQLSNYPLGLRNAATVKII